MKQENHFERCPNQKCNIKLNPVGNYSYGHSRLVQALRKYTLVLTPVFVIGFPLMGLLLGYATFVAPFAIVFLVTALFPKTTVISCHKCGHQSEHIGKLVTPPALPSAVDKTPMVLEPSEVVDHSVINLEEFQSLSKEPPPEEHNSKKRVYQGRVLHKPFFKGRGFNDFG